MSVFISVLLCAASSVSLFIPFFGTTLAACICTGDKTLVEKQQLLLELVQHPYQRDVQPRLLAIAATWQIETKLDQYTDITAVTEFLQYHKHGLIGHDEQFSIYNSVHRDQVIALFHLLYCAINWESLCKSLVWARFNVNAGQFIYALMTVLAHRKDLEGLILPPIYEIDPHLFFPSEVIQYAKLLKESGFHNEEMVDDAHHIVIQSNYTGDKTHLNVEQLMSYFTEDIELNAYYHNLHIASPFWFGGRKENLRKIHRGEVFLFKHQQLVARYNLERSSNNLGQIEEFSWRGSITTGYYSYLTTRQGYAFAARDNHHFIYQPNNYFDIDRIITYESRLLDAIDSGYALLPNGTYYNIKTREGIDALGNLIHGNPDSFNQRYYRYMDTVYRVLGRSTGSDHLMRETIQPNILEHPETQLRDPAYWQWMNRLNLMWWNFKENLVPYGTTEISFAPIRILTIEVDALSTYFCPFEADITNAVDVAPLVTGVGRIAQHEGRSFVIKARQWRLHHTPFKINVCVSSLQDMPAVVRIFLGPKFDNEGRTISINENRRNFVLLDVSKQDLKKGSNIILRSSREFSFGKARDRPSFFEMFKGVNLKADTDDAPSGFPNRLLLPKGTECGQIYQLFVHVAPFKPSLNKCSCRLAEHRIDSMAHGYPLDRPINERIWHTANMRYHDVTIFHKNYNEINVTTVVADVLVFDDNNVPNALQFD